MCNKIILVVDDEPNICEVIKLLLAEENHECVTTNKIVDALDEFQRIKPYLVITDLRLKNHRDGATLAQMLHQQDPLCSFIAMSGYLDGAFNMGFLLGSVFCDIIQKPFEADDLHQAVDGIWQRRQRWDKIVG